MTDLTGFKLKNSNEVVEEEKKEDKPEEEKKIDELNQANLLNVLG